MNSNTERSAVLIGDEFTGASALCDARLRERLVAIGARLWEAPDRSFPEMVSSEAELTALYRFLNNPMVGPEAVSDPHTQQTVARCAGADDVLIIHDTTEVEFRGEVRRRGLGRLRGNDQGLLLHTALAVANDGTRRPLGVLGSRTWTREVLGNTRTKGRRKSGGDYVHEINKESDRWWSLIQETEARVEGLKPIHVFDREGDAYVLLRTMLDHDVRFVTRMARDRTVLDENDDRVGRVSELLLDVQDVLTLEVPVTARSASTIPKGHSPRESRIAKLAVGAAKLLLQPPNYINGSPESLEVSVVHVREIDTPDGAEPISWVLITSEPAKTREQIRTILHLYQTRWLIEEFFKALKTGCALEKRQLESYESITVAIALFLPIAWQLLLLRQLARAKPDQSATLALTPTQIEVLRAAVPAVALPARPTLREALRAVAYLGGHYLRRDPGWIVLGRGLQQLLNYEAGWHLREAREK